MPAGSQREKLVHNWLTENVLIILFTWENYSGDRLRGKNYVEAKTYLVKRDGPYCQVCGLAVLNPFTDLQINHVNGIKTDNHRWNLNLAHGGCNTAQFNSMSDDTLNQLNLRERNFSASTRISASTSTPIKPVVLGHDASDELRLNFDYEEEYRKAVIKIVKRPGIDLLTNEPPVKFLHGLDLGSVNAAASEWAGNNPKTGYSYMAKVTNPINGFIEEAKTTHPPIGAKFLRFRKLEYYSLSVEEITKMHPKAGLRTTWYQEK